MVIANRSARALHRVTAVLFLSYVLVSSMWAPFAVAERSRSGPTRANKTQEHATPPYREGELLVRFRPGVSQPVKDLILSTQGARRKKELRGESGVETLQLPRGRESSAALELLMNPQVEFAEPNFLIAKEDSTPNDPQFQEQWSLHNTGQTGGQQGADINASVAWQTTMGSSATCAQLAGPSPSCPIASVNLRVGGSGLGRPAGWVPL